MNALVAAFGIALLSFSGVLFLSVLRTRVEKKLKKLLAFAGGVILATAITLSIEGFHLVDPVTALVSILSGFVGMFLIQKILPETHHHHSQDCEHSTPKKHGIKMLIGDAIHNIADGIIIAVTFSHSIELGIITALGIAVHELIQEVSEFFVLRDAGFSNKKALIFNFLTALTIVLGVGTGLLISDNIELQAILLGISAGVFFQIALQDIIPFRDFIQLKQKKSRTNTALFVVGGVLIFALGILAPHSHDEHTHEHEANSGHHDSDTHETLDFDVQNTTLEQKDHTHSHHHDYDH